jgi:hypothetical protein
MALPVARPTLVLAGLAGLVVVAVAATNPPIDRRTVRSLLPWMAAVGLLRALAPIVPSGGLVETLFTPPAPTLLTIVLFGIALGGGVAITRIVGEGDSAPFVTDWGLGFLFVLFVYVLYRAVGVPLDRLVSAATALVVLSLAALVVYALVFRLTPAVVPVADLTGVAAIWGHALAVPIGIARPPAPAEPFLRLARELSGTVAIPPAWLAISGRLLGVALALVIVVRFVESARRERLAYLLLAVLAGVGLVPGVETIVAPIFTSQ